MKTERNQITLTLAPAVRSGDPVTCREPKSRVASVFGLLATYTLADLTDEEAVQMLLGHPATLADEGLRRRASDLRALGWITPTGATRPNSRGSQCIICAITDIGRDAHMNLFVNNEEDN